jgi:hypothetical protein
MPDLLAVRVVGRIARARRARLNHLLADESAAQTYQVCFGLVWLEGGRGAGIIFFEGCLWD